MHVSTTDLVRDTDALKLISKDIEMMDSITNPHRSHQMGPKCPIRKVGILVDPMISAMLDNKLLPLQLPHNKME